MRVADDVDFLPLGELALLDPVVQLLGSVPKATMLCQLVAPSSPWTAREKVPMRVPPALVLVAVAAAATAGLLVLRARPQSVGLAPSAGSSDAAAPAAGRTIVPPVATTNRRRPRAATR